MRKIRIFSISVFCIMLVFFFGMSCLLPQREYSEIENRMLEEKPEFSWQEIRHGEYQEHYERYLNDQMFLREQWVKLAVRLERFVGKRDINDVYVGKDGYLLEKYVGETFDADQVKENIHQLSCFLNEAVERYGKQRVACMMLPSKANAMPSKLPGYAKANEERETIEALKNQLAHQDILLDMTQELQKHQEEYIYYRTDHHWTTLGAYYGYGAWAAMTGHKQRALKEYQRETVFEGFYGTTYNKAPIGVPGDNVELFHSPEENGIRVNLDDGDIVSDSFYFPEEASRGFNRYNVFFSKNTFKIVVDTKARTGRSLLLLKDSFANCFVPFLAGDYEQIVMIDYRYGKENIHDIMAEFKNITDILVMYNVEKFMQDFHLYALNKKADTIEEFDAADFLGD